MEEIYKEIIVTTTAEGADLVADAFFSIGCSGVKIVDKNDILDVIKNEKYWDYVDEDLLNISDFPTKVSGFVSVEDCASKITELLEEIRVFKDVDFGSLEITTLDINNDEWYENWKKYYKPIEAGNFLIIPKWMKPDNLDNKIEILIDPGMAFGTGEHESTRMCLMLLSTINVKDKYIIDVGTGSGILGIASVKSGARQAYMCDIDSLSIKASTENSSLNNVSDKTIIECSDLLKQDRAPCDIMLANLTADILTRLSSGITKYIINGGKLICSGIIHSRLNEVIDAFVKEGLEVEQHICMGEWDALLFRK